MDGATHFNVAVLPTTVTAGNAPTCFCLSGRASLLVRDASGAAEALAAFDATGVHGPYVEARRTSMLAGLAALDGRVAEATSLYLDATRRFADLGLPVEQAFTAIEMATLLDPDDPEVRAVADSARTILTGDGFAFQQVPRNLVGQRQRVAAGLVTKRKVPFEVRAPGVVGTRRLC